jgi:hypothetical protein
MKVRRTIRSLALTAMPLILASACTAEPDRVLLRRHAGDNYCHMKVETQGDPKTPGEREVVDYYGPCDERPSPRR